MPDDELIGVGAIARLFGVSRQRAHQITKKDDFPGPAGAAGDRKVWRRQDVEDWAEAAGRTP